MYEIDKEKRYNVAYGRVGASTSYLKNVSLKIVERDFVVVIDEKEVTAYVAIPDCFLQGCSEDIVIFRADGGNHFTDYGIYEGMFLL